MMANRSRGNAQLDEDAEGPPRLALVTASEKPRVAMLGSFRLSLSSA